MAKSRARSNGNHGDVRTENFVRVAHGHLGPITGAGVMADRRTKRQRTRYSQKASAIRDSF